MWRKIVGTELRKLDCGNFDVLKRMSVLDHVFNVNFFPGSILESFEEMVVGGWSAQEDEKLFCDLNPKVIIIING